MYKELRELLHRKCGAKDSFGPMSFGSGPYMRVRLKRPEVAIGMLDDKNDLAILNALNLPHQLVDTKSGKEFLLQDDIALWFAKLCLDYNLIPLWKRHFAAEMLYDNDAL